MKLIQFNGQKEREIEALEKRIEELIDSDDEMKKKKELLKSIPGIGDKTAEVILSELKGGVEQFENARQLAAYVGITPNIRQSGKSLNSSGCISRKGNHTLRKALYFPAIVSKQHNPILNTFCKRLTEKGKAGKQIICAAIRKLLHIIFGILKSMQPFDPSYRNLSFSS